MGNVSSLVGKTSPRPKAFIALGLPADKQTAPRVFRAVLPYSTGTAARVARLRCPILRTGEEYIKTMMGQKQLPVIYVVVDFMDLLLSVRTFWNCR